MESKRRQYPEQQQLQQQPQFVPAFNPNSPSRPISGVQSSAHFGGDSNIPPLPQDYSQQKMIPGTSAFSSYTNPNGPTQGIMSPMTSAPVGVPPVNPNILYSPMQQPFPPMNQMNAQFQQMSLQASLPLVQTSPHNINPESIHSIEPVPPINYSTFLAFQANRKIIHCPLTLQRPVYGCIPNTYSLLNKIKIPIDKY